MNSIPTRQFLNDAVELTCLPIFDGTDSPSTVKRLMLPQGEFAILSPSCPTIRFLAYLTFPKDKKRGNHYHLEKVEFLYVVDGNLRLKVLDTLSKKCETCEVPGGTLVRINPRIAHGYLAIKESYAIEYSANAYNPRDTVSMDVI